MPFVSRAQQRWGHTAAGEKALGGPSAVAEWDAATPAGHGVPERVKPKAPAAKRHHAANGHHGLYDLHKLRDS